mmetsp:Transcript_8343/g.29282  ORF Transcript_8343/g.29282 Transcript_8343/m.29282 type:complete len:202 (+) Transcript_8343:922-1527(+)
MDSASRAVGSASRSAVSSPSRSSQLNLAYGLEAPAGFRAACCSRRASFSDSLPLISSILASRDAMSASTSSLFLQRMGLSSSARRLSAHSANASAFLAHSMRCASRARCFCSSASSIVLRAVKRERRASMDEAASLTSPPTRSTQVWITPLLPAFFSTVRPSFSSLVHCSRSASSYRSWRFSAASQPATDSPPSGNGAASV